MSRHTWPLPELTRRSRRHSVSRAPRRACHSRASPLPDCEPAGQWRTASSGERKRDDRRRRWAVGARRGASACAVPPQAAVVARLQRCGYGGAGEAVQAARCGLRGAGVRAWTPWRGHGGTHCPDSESLSAPIRCPGPPSPPGSTCAACRSRPGRWMGRASPPCESSRGAPRCARRACRSGCRRRSYGRRRAREGSGRHGDTLGGWGVGGCMRRCAEGGEQMSGMWRDGGADATRSIDAARGECRAPLGSRAASAVWVAGTGDRVRTM